MSAGPLRRALGVAAVLSAFAAREARGQLHADVDLEAGAIQRLLSSRAPGLGDPSVGPMFELSGHVAVFPLLRAGAYVSLDLAPVGGRDLRELLAAGFSGRLYSPWPRGAWRAWLALGFGFVAARAPASGTVPTTAGGFFEIPAGVGASLRLSRTLELVGDLGARIGFGFSGSMYNPSPTPPVGNDSFGVFVVLGVAYEL